MPHMANIVDIASEILFLKKEVMMKVYRSCTVATNTYFESLAAVVHRVVCCCSASERGLW